MDKKFLLRHNLDAYSEEEFARKLRKKGIDAYFPFKDEGIDILARDKNNKLYTFQIKAGSLYNQNTYRFNIKNKDFLKGKDYPNFYYVFGMVISNNIEYIAIPYKDFAMMTLQCKKDGSCLYYYKKTEIWWVLISHKKGSFYLKPNKGNIKIDKYLFEKWMM